jgi:hypothetical protein
VARGALRPDGRRCSRRRQLCARRSCAGGYLAVTKWLTERFGLTANDIRAERNEALIENYLNGQLETAKLLMERFNLTAEDVCSENNWVLLRRSCANGHLKVA